MRYEFYNCSRVEDNIVDDFIIGPLYKKDFEKDLIYNSGKEQKYIEITTNEVNIKTKDDKIKKVWLDIETGRYYDYNTEDILGKIQKAQDGNLLQDELGNYLVEKNLLDFITI